jgi:hypothetical protein
MRSGTQKHYPALCAQNVTVCPFRVVDEINQGMDQINERKVFTLLVEAACQAGTPQCFMFTPKLLPDLPYTEDVMPMLIFNGAHIADITSGFGGVVRACFGCSLGAWEGLFTAPGPSAV